MKLPKMVQKKLERLSNEIEQARKYANQCSDPADREYWIERERSLQEKRFLIKVIGYGLAALSQERRNK